MRPPWTALALALPALEVQFVRGFGPASPVSGVQLVGEPVLEEDSSLATVAEVGRDVTSHLDVATSCSIVRAMRHAPVGWPVLVKSVDGAPRSGAHVGADGSRCNVLFFRSVASMILLVPPASGDAFGVDPSGLGLDEALVEGLHHEVQVLHPEGRRTYSQCREKTYQSQWFEGKEPMYLD